MDLAKFAMSLQKKKQYYILPPLEESFQPVYGQWSELRYNNNIYCKDLLGFNLKRVPI